MDSAPTTSLPSYSVYLGVWTNWSHGSVFGYTLTLNRDQGNLLIAFIAFFVSYVGTRLWRILCLISHALGSSEAPQDALHHQRQAILCSSSSAESGLWSMGEIMWAWRSKARPKRLLMSTAPIALLAGICSVGFILASGFSSRISSVAGDEVLISGTRCGTIGVTVDQIVERSKEILTAYQPWLTKSWFTSVTYAQECYRQGTDGFLDCGTFTSKALPFTVTLNASCPFAPGMCTSDNSSIIVDSGLLDSNEHFGLNAPADQRVQIRYVQQCAPLVTEGYKTEAVVKNASVMTYKYGRTIWGNNYTYLYPMEQHINLNMTSPDYTLSVVGAQIFNGSLFQESTFAPIPELWQDDGDITIIFLSSNFMPFLGLTTDDWYKATIPSGKTGFVSSSGRLQAYIHDEVASPLACINRYQFCSPGLPETENGRCTPLGGFYDTDYLVNGNPEPLLQNEDEMSRIRWIWNLSARSQLLELIRNLRAQILTSRNSMVGSFQGSLPPNQWQLEVQHWFRAILANIQLQFTITAAGTSDPTLETYFKSPPQNAQEERLCHNQKIKSSAYASFSMFGLLFIAIVGGFIVITSYVLDPILAILQRRGMYKNYLYLEWVTNSTLQLQRLAHESVGSGTWFDTTSHVPVTKEGEKLAQLDLTDLKRPCIRPNNLRQGTLFATTTKDDTRPLSAEGDLKIAHTRSTEVSSDSDPIDKV